jgi:hypothetical protein
MILTYNGHDCVLSFIYLYILIVKEYTSISLLKLVAGSILLSCIWLQCCFVFMNTLQIWHISLNLRWDLRKDNKKTAAIHLCNIFHRYWDSSVIYRWATGWMIGGSRPGRGWEFFSSTPCRSTQSPIQWVSGALSLGLKLPGREIDHSPPSSAEVKENVELYLHSPNTSSWRGAQWKHRDNLYTRRLKGKYRKGRIKAWIRWFHHFGWSNRKYRVIQNYCRGFRGL